MTTAEVEAELTHTPFVPIRFHLVDGRTFDVARGDAAHLLSYGVLFLIGLRAGSHRADGYDRFPYEAITRIEPRPFRRASRRKKAS